MKHKGIPPVVALLFAVGHLAAAGFLATIGWWFAAATYVALAVFWTVKAAKP